MQHVRIFLRVGGYIFLYIFVTSLCALISTYALYFLKIKVSQLVPQTFAQIAGFVFVFTFFKLYKKDRLKELIPRLLSVKEIVFLFLLSVVGRVYLFVVIFFLLVMIIIIACPHSIDSLVESLNGGTDYQWELFKAAALWEWGVGFVAIVILAPIIEEFLMRGVVFNTLKKKYSVWASLIFTNIFFMIMHVHPGLYPMTFLLGVMMTLVYMKWKNLAFPIIFHMFLNLQPFLYLFFTKR